MTNLPVRGLGNSGLILDVEPWDTPWEAWSNGSNVRFEDGKAMPAPIFRRGAKIAGSNLVDASGVGAATFVSGDDSVFLVDSFGRANLLGSEGTLTDVSGSSEVFTPIQANTQFTTTFLGDVFYLNRETHFPRYYEASSTAFAPIPNMDTPNWTCAILRAYSSFLVAFNVTKAGINNPILVKWSDATPAGAPPPDWSITTPNTLAGENPLSQANGPIIDAQALRSLMMIYTTRQLWVMQATGDGTFPFTFTKTWEDPRWGAISRNCSVEADGLHYVFGSGDLYVHDGTNQPQSIANGKVRNAVFNSLVRANMGACFVAHNPNLHEVWFCYPANTGPFTGGTGCSRAAVFNYRSQAWGIMELPNLTAATISTITEANEWVQDAPAKTWANVGGTWASELDTPNPCLLMAGANTLGTLLTNPGLLAVDPIFRGSLLGLPADPQANTPPFLEHGGISLDLAQLPLQNFKWVRQVNPLGYIAQGGPLQVQIGSAMFTAALPNYGPQIAFDPSTNYFVPGRASGRYVAVKFTSPLYCDFDLSGFDLDVVGGGRR